MPLLTVELLQLAVLSGCGKISGARSRFGPTAETVALEKTSTATRRDAPELERICFQFAYGNECHILFNDNGLLKEFGNIALYNTSEKLMKRIMKTSLWVILAVLFLFAGGSKLLDPDAHAVEFAHWGYPLWFLYMTGLIEVGSAVGLLIPAARLYAVLMLSITMVGASITHLRAGEMNAFPVPLVLLLLLLVLAWTMRPSKTSSSRDG